MSSTTRTKTTRIVTVDETTAVMLGVMRTIRSVRSEIHMTEMFMRALEAAELDAAEGAITLGTAMQLLVPVLGMIAAGIGIMAGISITEHRAAIPVAQTGGLVQQTGVAVIEKGEQIIPAGGGGGSMGDINFRMGPVYMDPEGMSITEIGSRTADEIRSALRGQTKIVPF